MSKIILSSRGAKMYKAQHIPSEAWILAENPDSVCMCAYAWVRAIIATGIKYLVPNTN